MVDLGALADRLSDPVVQRGIAIGVTWLVTLVLIRVNGRFFDALDQRLTAYHVPERRLAKLDFVMDIFLILLATFVTLHILGVSQALWGAVAVTSIAGVIVALAAQRLGENLLAGVVILFERPFIVGDTVEVDGRTGKVRRVTLHSTTLETPDGLKAIVPNSRVANIPVINFTANPDRRVVVAIDVEESVELDRVRRLLEATVRKERHLVEDRPVRVFARESLDEGVRFEVRYWVDRRFYAEHCLPSSTERILDALNEAGLTTAMPAQHVHVTQGG